MKPRFSLLRNLLLLDAAVLCLLGGLLIFAPEQIEAAFHFTNLPAGVSYLVGLWGCVLLTLSAGYVVAAGNPVRHVIWIQVGIARGLLECVLGIVCLARGLVTFSQAGVGTLLGLAIAAAYIVLYPRRPRLVQAARPPAPSTPQTP